MFSTLFSSIKAKLQPFVTKLRFLTTRAFWTTTVFTKIRQLFAKLLDIKPKHKHDYYPIGRWLVSKRLAFALVVILGVLCAVYIHSTLPDRPAAGSDAPTLPTYKYNSIPLKFHEGTVNILAADRHLAYTGAVKGGQCLGKGILYDSAGAKLYEGDFADDRFNGEGQLYYPDGTLHYQGSFSNNRFHGAGTSYRPNGTLEYEGAHVSGYRSGHGKLYNSAATQIFEGSFLQDEIVYHELLDQTTKDLASMYTGKTALYAGLGESCATLEEIDALYSVRDGSESLAGEWTVDRVYILHNQVTIGDSSYTSVQALTAALGQPDYFGTAWVNLPEAISINTLVQNGNQQLGRVAISAASDLEGIYAIASYDKNATIYLYTYVHEGLLYTFYCSGAGANDFLFYSIELP